jgi:hypothetical protein
MADFSEKVGTQKQAMYRTYNLEAAETLRRERINRELPAERLSRLKRELRELEVDMSKDTTKSNSLVNLLTHFLDQYPI